MYIYIISTTSPAWESCRKLRHTRTIPMHGPYWRNKPNATAQRDESCWSAAIRTGDQRLKGGKSRKFHVNVSRTQKWGSLIWIFPVEMKKMSWFHSRGFLGMCEAFGTPQSHH